MGVLSDRQLQRELIDVGKIKNFDPNPDNTGRISAGLSSYGIDVRVGYEFRIFTPVPGVLIDPKAFDEKAYTTVNVPPPFHDWRGNKNNEYERCLWCDKVEHKDEHGYDQGRPNNCDEVPSHIVLPPHSFALAETIEELTIPRDCLVIALSKSTLLRCGLYNSTSVLEPEWTGTVTLELTNLTCNPMKVYAGEGICQLVFLRSDERVEQAIDALSFDNPVLRNRLGEILTASCGKSYADKKGKYQNQHGITLPSVRGDK